MGLVQYSNGGQLRHIDHVQTLLNGVDSTYELDRGSMRLLLGVIPHFKSREGSNSCVVSVTIIVTVTNWVEYKGYYRRENIN